MPGYVGPSLIVHASCEYSAATPPVVTDNQGVVSVARSAVGVWVVTLAEEIDPTQRNVVLTPIFATGTSVQLDPAVQTDSTIGILAFDLAVPAADDIACRVTVLRLTSPN